MPILQNTILRHREGKPPAQAHTATCSSRHILLQRGGSAPASPLPQKPRRTGRRVPKSLGLSSSVPCTTTSPPQTSTSVTRQRRPPHSASTRAASTRMAPSAVSAAQDSHPRTSRTTARPPDPGPEPSSPGGRPAGACLRALPALPSCPLAHMRTGMLAWRERTTDRWTDGRRDFLHCFTTPTPPVNAASPGLSHSPLHISTPFYKNVQLKKTHLFCIFCFCLPMFLSLAPEFVR